MKRAVSVILALLLFCMSLTAFARANPQLSSYGVACEAGDNGLLTITAIVVATHPNMTQIGFPDISLFVKDGYGWKPVVVNVGLYNPSTPAGSYEYSFTYQGVRNQQYYASASYFARDNNGTGTGNSTSGAVTAK